MWRASSRSVGQSWSFWLLLPVLLCWSSYSFADEMPPTGISSELLSELTMIFSELESLHAEQTILLSEQRSELDGLRTDWIAWEERVASFEERLRDLSTRLTRYVGQVEQLATESSELRADTALLRTTTSGLQTSLDELSGSWTAYREQAESRIAALETGLVVIAVAGGVTLVTLIVMLIAGAVGQ